MKELSFTEKMSLYFIDFSIMPLLIFENYLKNFECKLITGQKKDLPMECSKNDLDRMATCSDLLSLGDNLNSMCY